MDKTGEQAFVLPTSNKYSKSIAITLRSPIKPLFGSVKTAVSFLQQVFFLSLFLFVVVWIIGPLTETLHAVILIVIEYGGAFAPKATAWLQPSLSQSIHCPGLYWVHFCRHPLWSRKLSSRKKCRRRLRGWKLALRDCERSFFLRLFVRLW